ncbi:MAG TPA: FtsX-like permease family protein [Ktedonobacterales bacterium]|nr:FtsX-like permease family protein [Ktedonobacterales bacterium]
MTTITMTKTPRPRRRWLPLSPLGRKSLADISRRKGRTLLVVLGILVGVGGLTAINVSADTLYAAFAYSAGKTPTPDIALGVRGVDDGIIPVIAAVANVKTVQLTDYYSTRWKIAATPGHANMQIVGERDFAHIALFPIQITSGHAPGPGEVVMETGDRALQNFSLGDTITVDTPSGPTPLTVVGTARALGHTSAAFSASARAFMSAAGLSALTGGDNTTEIQVRVADKSQETATLLALKTLLAERHIPVNYTYALDGYWDPGPINGLFIILRVLSGIALVLTGFLIINTVTTLVAEQTKIIGAMKAAGATTGTVMRGYLTSVGIYGLLGTALGLVAGVYGGYQLTLYLATLITLDLGPFTLAPWIVGMALLVGIGVPLAAALLPLWSGTRITVREAMAAYGVTSGNGRARVALARRLPWISEATWLGLRGLFRRRGRAILTLLALTLASTAFLSIQTTTYSVNTFITQLFSQYDYDAYVGTKALPYDVIRAKLLAVPNVARVERFEQDVVRTRGGQVVLTGVEQDAQLYRHTVLAGRWFTPGEQNALVISDTLAQATGARVGQTLTFSSSTSSATWLIVGEVHDLNGGLGLKGVALTPVDDLHAFEQADPTLAGSFIVQAADRSPAAVNAMADALDATLSRQGLTPFVSTAQQQIHRNQTQFQILYVLLYAVAAIVALVGVLGLFNTLTTSVLERRREIGILRSMGATGWRVAGVFWTEGLALTVIAWLLAAAIGVPAAYGFVSLISAVLLPIPFAFNPLTIVITLGFILACATLASVIPAISAARVRTADILRYE